ncbi:hypothetical protein [Candidatus Synechococcus spongiarum]|uniref:hypothetical protein n=1 Tax=Candidatus Synechococcus spongiarum TaxID=431041 RepID=UPI000B03AC62|nr:hypothetical protein [Candidatus Synechococcus spongiarum]
MTMGYWIMYLTRQSSIQRFSRHGKARVIVPEGSPWTIAADCPCRRAANLMALTSSMGSGIGGCRLEHT